MIFTKKNKERIRIKHEYRIGVFGVQPRCGTTHICILLAWYLSEFLGKRVMLINLSDNNDISSLRKFYKVKQWKEREQMFSCEGITFIEQGGLEQAEYTKEKQYDFCILDLGSNPYKAMQKLVCCDKKIVVGNTAPWSQDFWCLLETLLSERKEVDSFRGIMNLSDKHRIQPELPVKSYCIGFEPMLFHPGKSTIKVFEKILFS